MDKVIKQQWVDALRSGDYEQGQERLNAGGKFCCLGVLCDLGAKNGADVQVGKDSDMTRYNSATTSLPLSMQRWSGVDGRFGTLPQPVEPGDEEYTSLAALNDSGRYTFAQIADIIEEQL